MNSAIFERPRLPDGLLPGSLRIREILYEAEAPVVFTTATEQGLLLLATVVHEDRDSTITLLSPATDSLVASLKSGQSTVRDAMTASWLWLHRDSADHGTWVVTTDEVNHYLPLAGTPLHYGLGPVLRTRAVGNDIKPGRMPASVVAFVADATRRAVKMLLDLQLEKPAGGRPTEGHRSRYDLPVRSFQFASFEVSFDAPEDDGLSVVDVKLAMARLENGLRWAAEGQGEFQSVERNEREAVLRAALLLTPPVGGAIDEVQVSGTWMSKGPVTLDRDARRRVRHALKAVDSEQVVRYVGRVGEVDRDNLTFILRETGSTGDLKASFDEELLDELVELLGDGVRVAVAGLERGGRVFVSAVSRIHDGADDTTVSGH